MDGIEKLGSTRGFHIEEYVIQRPILLLSIQNSLNPSTSHTTYTFIAETQIQRGADPDIHSRSSITSG